MKHPSDLSPEAALHAELYANLHRGEPGDVRFYLEACAGNLRVLELGAGAGRIAFPLAQAGCSVVAVELDPGMLFLGRRDSKLLPPEVQPRVVWQCADMRTIAGLGEFGRVVIAHNTLFCLPTEDDISATLKAAKAHLAPRGKVLLDVYRAEGFHDWPDDDNDGVSDDDGAFDEGAFDEEEHVVSFDLYDVHYDVFERSRWNRKLQRIDAHYRFTHASGSIERVIVHHYQFHKTLERLLNAAGLSVTASHGGFDGEPLDADAEFLVIEAAHSPAG